MPATRIPIGLFAALLALTSCDGTTPQEPVLPAVLVLEAVTPLSATGIVGEELDVAPVVRVRGDGRPVKGVQVTFAIGGGFVGSTAVMTDAGGLATPGPWRLGWVAGLQTLTVRAAGRSLVFTADAQPGPVTSLAVAGGNGQRAAVGTALPAQLSVKATDRYGNVVSDAAVTFAVVDGGGSLAPGASITGSDGIAESRWTLGTTAGRQHVRAQTGDAIAQFTADACQPGPCSWELVLVVGGNIVIFDGTTGGTRQLTNDDRSYTPAWSPDGERIAFARTSFVDEDRQLDGIYVMNAVGTDVTRVTGPGFAMPTWSPQGDALAFVGPHNCPSDQYCGAIYVQELSVGSMMRLVAPAGFAPDWSPDGSRIAFVGHNGLIADEDYYSLRLVNPDGSGLTEITQSTSAYIGRPTWSPDGTRIAFDMRWDVYVVHNDGTGRTQLTTYAAALTPAWSPDGTRVAYADGGFIMEIPAEGGEPTLLTAGYWPSWRP